MIRALCRKDAPVESSPQISPLLLGTLRLGVDPEDRSRAAALILIQGPSATATLLQTLSDPDYDHPFVVELLGRIGNTAATRELARLMTRDTDEPLAEACATALRGFGAEAVLELCAALANPICDVTQVAQLLAELRDPWAIPALASRFRTEKNPLASKACLTAIIGFGSAAASEIGSLLTTARLYPASIARAAIAIGDPRLAPALAARLRWETDLLTLELCISGLRQLGQDPIPELVESLQDSDRDPKITASILGKLRDPRAIPALAQAVRAHPHRRAREWCLNALEAMGAVSVPTLCELLAQPRLDTQKVARALRTIGDPSAIPALLHRMAQTDDPLVVVACLEALGALGDATTVGKLIESLSDPREGVAPAAANSIANLATRHSFREAGQVIRILRGKLSILRRTPEEDRTAYRYAIDQLEAMAATHSSLPVPAFHQSPDHHLPRPSERSDGSNG
jgi:HEAT repeat protein